MTGSGICRDSLLARGDGELDFGRSFQPNGSGPVMVEVWTAGGGEEQEEELEEVGEEDEEEDAKGRVLTLKTANGGQE